MNHLKEFLGQDICSQLLFIHALTGCDLTSRIFGVGKRLLARNFWKVTVLGSCANTFSLPNQTTAVIDDFGCHAMAVLCGGNSTDSLATMQYNTFSRKVVTSSLFVTPQCLNLLLRFTVAGRTTWTGKKDGIDAVNWWWRMQNDQLIRIMSQMTAAPDSLLKIIHWNAPVLAGHSAVLA